MNLRLLAIRNELEISLKKVQAELNREVKKENTGTLPNKFSQDLIEENNVEILKLASQLKFAIVEKTSEIKFQPNITLIDYLKIKLTSFKNRNSSEIRDLSVLSFALGFGHFGMGYPMNELSLILTAGWVLSLLLSKIYLKK